MPCVTITGMGVEDAVSAQLVFDQWTANASKLCGGHRTQAHRDEANTRKDEK